MTKIQGVGTTGREPSLPALDTHSMGGLRHVGWRWKHADTPEEGHWHYVGGVEKPEPGFRPDYEARVTFEKVFVPAEEYAQDQIDKRSKTDALTAQKQEPETLDERMKAAGMYSIAEIMGVTPLTKWKSNPAINTIDAFAEWLDRKTSEYLRMKASYDLGDKSEDDELYEWVLAHAGVFSSIRGQFIVANAAPSQE